MNTNEVEMSIMSVNEKKELGQILNDHGIIPSFHRLLILKELRARRDHPSADMLFQSLSPILPTLSKTTIYNTMNLFERRTLASCLAIEGHEMRYDHDRHGPLHFYCLACHAIIDPPDSINPILPQNPPAGFEIRQIQTIIKGICASCKKKDGQNQSI